MLPLASLYVRSEANTKSKSIVEAQEEQECTRFGSTARMIAPILTSLLSTVSLLVESLVELISQISQSMSCAKVATVWAFVRLATRVAQDHVALPATYDMHLSSLGVSQLELKGGSFFSLLFGGRVKQIQTKDSATEDRASRVDASVFSLKYSFILKGSSRCRVVGSFRKSDFAVKS